MRSGADGRTAGAMTYTRSRAATFSRSRTGTSIVTTRKPVRVAGTEPIRVGTPCVRTNVPSVFTSSVRIATRNEPVPDLTASCTDGVILSQSACGCRARSRSCCIAGSMAGFVGAGFPRISETTRAFGTGPAAALVAPETATKTVAATMRTVNEIAHARRTNNPIRIPPVGRSSSKTLPRVPPPTARPTSSRIEETRYKHSDRTKDRLQGEARPSDRPRDHDRGAAGREVLDRDLPDAILLQVPHDVRIPLEEVHPEAVVLHPMELIRDLRVPLEGDDQGADLVVLPVPELVRMEGIRLQAVQLDADRLDGLLEVRGVHARGDGPHPSRGAGIETGEGVVGETLLVPQVPPEPTVQTDPSEQEVCQVQGIVVRMTSGDRGAADRDVGLGLVRHRDRDAARFVRRRRRDRRDPFGVGFEAGQRSRDRLFDELPVHIPGDGEDQALRSDGGFVEVDQVAPPDAAHPVGPALRVAAVRMVIREHETRELTGGPRGRVVRLDAQVVHEFAPHPVDLARRERRMGETVDEDSDRLPQGVARAPSAEAEELLAVVELEGRPDAFQSVGELRGPETAGAAQEEPRRELGDPVRIALGGHAGRDAPAERDERVRREGVGDQDGPVPQGGAVGELQPVPSWAWNRTRDRCSSTRYVRATSRMRSTRTFSTFARRRSPKSQDVRPSPALSSIPWNVTPSCSYRAQERTCCFALSTSVRLGGVRRNLSTSRSIACSIRSRETSFAAVADVIRRDGSSFISCRTPTSVASFDSTRARYSRFDRGRQSPEAKEIRPLHPPRTVESKIRAGVSSWAADGICHPMERRSAGPGRTRSLRRSPRCSGSESRSGSGGASGFSGEKASRTCCIATAGSKPPTRMSEALFGA